MHLLRRQRRIQGGSLGSDEPPPLRPGVVVENAITAWFVRIKLMMMMMMMMIIKFAKVRENKVRFARAE